MWQALRLCPDPEGYDAVQARSPGEFAHGVGQGTAALLRSAASGFLNALGQARARSLAGPRVPRPSPNFEHAVTSDCGVTPCGPHAPAPSCNAHVRDLRNGHGMQTPGAVWRRCMNAQHVTQHTQQRLGFLILT